jgi:polysaccharide export outer membrane protein
MTVLQVLSEAGGLTEFAKRKNIYVLRMDNGAPHRFVFNYESVIKGQNLVQNIQVLPGDTIVVPQ